jgi:hypothetical protein
MTRECGTCTLCCKTMGVDEIAKPRGQWCPHCAVGKGCNIYHDRPGECRSFNCTWLVDEQLGPEWKPEKSKIVLIADGDNNRITAYVDIAAPEAWRRQPYFEQLQQMMRAGLAQGRRLYICVGKNLTLLLPDGEHFLGVVGKGDVVEVEKIPNAPGRYRAFLRKSSG